MQVLDLRERVSGGGLVAAAEVVLQDLPVGRDIPPAFLDPHPGTEGTLAPPLAAMAHWPPAVQVYRRREVAPVAGGTEPEQGVHVVGGWDRMVDRWHRLVTQRAEAHGPVLRSDLLKHADHVLAE